MITLDAGMRQVPAMPVRTRAEGPYALPTA
jgi:hypothetical protein